MGGFSQNTKILEGFWKRFGENSNLSSGNTESNQC